MEERIDIPELDAVEDLATARFLLRTLVATAEAQAATIGALSETIDALRHEIAELRRALYGQKRERVEPVAREIARKKRAQETPEQAEARRQKTRHTREQTREDRREATEVEVVSHAIASTHCDGCGAELAGAVALGEEVSEEYDYVSAHIVRREHRRERRRCECGAFHSGPAPARVVEGGLHGPGLHAHVVVAKCADSMPLERLARGLKRGGVPASKSTLCDLFHRSAELLAPLSARLLEVIAGCAHVHADETPIKVLDTKTCRRGWMWDFIGTDGAGHTLVGYAYSADRSGQTPQRVLGGSTGTLQVDAYTGYNTVTTPEGRSRSGCWAHARRKFFDARATSPELADEAIALIRAIYEVEHAAVERGIVGSAAHLALRRTTGKEAVDAFYGWAGIEAERARPKSPLGGALRYALGQREALVRFLDDPKVALDNNLAERHLRLIALGRKNYLFVGHDRAGRNLATLQTLVSTCLANEINPQLYLADVLMRVQDHPHSQIDALLPWNWRPPPGD